MSRTAHTWAFPAQKDFKPPEDALGDFPCQGRRRVILGQTMCRSARRLAELQRHLRTTNNPFRSRPHARWLLRRSGPGCGGYGPLSLGSDIAGLAAGAGVSLRRLCPHATFRWCPHAATVPAVPAIDRRIAIWR